MELPKFAFYALGALVGGSAMTGRVSLFVAIHVFCTRKVVLPRARWQTWTLIDGLCMCLWSWALPGALTRSITASACLGKLLTAESRTQFVGMALWLAAVQALYVCFANDWCAAFGMGAEYVRARCSARAAHATVSDADLKAFAKEIGMKQC